MTTITPEHNAGICHAASENRRTILEKLEELAMQLEKCENEMVASNGYQPPLEAGRRRSSQGQRRSSDSSRRLSENLRRPSRNNCEEPGGNEQDACFVLCSRGPPCTGPPVQQMAGTGARMDGAHGYEKKYTKLDPSKAPLSVCPEYPRSPKKPITPPEKLKFDLERTKSRALIGGTLYTGCDCVRRNGLQDQCRRTECRGRPECMTRPEPTCLPSQGPQIVPQQEKETRKDLEAENTKVCCQCPPDCYERRQQQKENQYVQQQQQQQPMQLCCYRCPLPESFDPNGGSRFAGQFEKRLQVQEVDKVRGPLMNR